jgi:hypothetical protein
MGACCVTTPKVGAYLDDSKNIMILYDEKSNIVAEFKYHGLKQITHPPFYVCKSFPNDCTVYDEHGKLIEKPIFTVDFRDYGRIVYNGNSYTMHLSCFQFMRRVNDEGHYATTPQLRF